MWDSYLRYIEQEKVDAAFQAEGPGERAADKLVGVFSRVHTHSSLLCLVSSTVVNTGNFVIVPTPQGIQLAAAWTERALPCLNESVSEQNAMRPLFDRGNFTVCQNPGTCEASRANVGSTVLERNQCVQAVSCKIDLKFLSPPPACF